ncbi:hypothetical protein LUZ60_004351 [Juncus effusus]|nr:hypothetical protein LUZ60_004351 [Juncus effusus]
MKLFSLLPLVLSLAALTLYVSAINELTTSSRWIVDESNFGTRVKLACVNWPSHLEPMVPEGLSKQPIDSISKSVVSKGFNCVRLTYATFMLTDKSVSSRTVRQSFQSLNLTKTIEGTKVNNPTFLDLTLIQAYQAVVSNLAKNNLMVILDNHVSKPMWCCGRNDGNGFFGDEFFDPNVWIQGLTKMATLSNNMPNVIGMSLRNELRGANQTVDNWYRYMQKGAEAVYKTNPKLLVIISGLYFDNDLSFISNRPLNLSFKNKLVFEVHWYSFSDSQAWKTLNPNQACAKTSGSFMRKAGFLLKKGFPLFLSEFGVDNRAVSENDNKYFDCVLAKMAELDLDWAVWTLQGSYYFRQGVEDRGEAYGVLGGDWKTSQNATVLKRIQALQRPLNGPGSAENFPIPSHQKFFHPATGMCLALNNNPLKSLKLFNEKQKRPLRLQPCTDPTSAWSYSTKGNLEMLHVKLERRSSCLKAGGDGKSPVFTQKCSEIGTSWSRTSSSKMHLSNGNRLCLDVAGKDGKTIVTKPCKCLNTNSKCDPGSQWFQIIKVGY